MIDWRKSSYSQGGGTDCVEAAELADGLRGLRDSKHPQQGNLSLSTKAFAGFVARIKSGAVDL
jgi:hypothetical protein